MSNIEIQPVEMTQEVMSSLEEHGLIKRLYPGVHRMDVSEGQVGVIDMYITDKKYGSHKLISATINRNTFCAFGSHPDNEDVLLIGDTEVKDMYFLFSYLVDEELDNRIKTNRLEPKDFIAVKAKYNDPYVSFFTVLKGVPHGEATITGPGKPPSFFVTEPSDLLLNFTDFKDYKILIEGLTIS